MKKSLVALAVLAASGAAMAQSSVTLYGVGDAYVGTSKTYSSKATAPATNDQTQTVVGSGTLNGSRWGIKGTEDLGDGLKANFQFEQGFDISNAAAVSSTLQFSRQAYVGFSGAFGAVNLGRQYSPFDDVHGAADTVFDSTLSQMGAVAALGALADYNPRIDNAIKYQSNDYSGFKFAALIGLGEDKTAAANASQTTAFNVQYGAGPLWATLAYQVQKAQTPTPAAAYVTAVDIKNSAGAVTNAAGTVVPAVTATDTVDTKFTLVGGSYDFGVAKLRAVYEIAEKTTSKDKDWTLGVDVPVSKAAVVSLGYTKAKGEVDGATTANASGYALVGRYDLSPRTALYAGWNSIKADNNAGTDTDKITNFRVGVRHSF